MRQILLVLDTVLVITSGLRFTKYSRDALRAHNKLRVVPLKLDKQLCIDAQAHADTMARKDGLSYHDMAELLGKNQGENIHFEWGLINGIGFATKVTAEDAIKAWYDEIRTGAACMAHGVQLLWKSSQKFCQVQAVSRSGKTYTVARYFPRVCGNDDVWQCGDERRQQTYEKNIWPGFRLPAVCEDW